MATTTIYGQDLKLQTYLDEGFSKLEKNIQLSPSNSPLDTNASLIASNLYQVSSAYMPEFARNNPTGYTYLCRLELKIEKDLPLGLWLDIGDNSTTGNPSNANANVRFRFKLK